MSKKNDRYQQWDRYMTYALITDGFLFLLYLLFSGLGILWLKIITAILAIGISVLCLYFLYVSKELLKERSIWMTVGASAVILCILVSLILNFP